MLNEEQTAEVMQFLDREGRESWVLSMDTLAAVHCRFRLTTEWGHALFEELARFHEKVQAPEVSFVWQRSIKDEPLFVAIRRHPVLALATLISFRESEYARRAGLMLQLYDGWKCVYRCDGGLLEEKCPEDDIDACELRLDEMCREVSGQQ